MEKKKQADKTTIDFSKIRFSELTNEYGDLSTTGLYYQVFQGIPSYLLNDKSIDFEFSRNYIEKTYGGELQYIYNGGEVSPKDGEKIFCITYIFDNNLIIRISDHKLKFYFRERADKRIDDVILNTQDYKPIKTKEAYISFILAGTGGLKIIDSKLAPREVSIDENYNDDLKEKSESIIKHLNEKKSGIYLLHGDAGGGKSSYIRWLKTQTDKKFIFMPLNVAANVDSPELLGLMMGNEESVLIIEDAEKLIKSREGDQNSTIASLLNLSDGLIGQTLNIQVICTFNTHLSKIDSALKRKGRMLEAYEFKKLDLAKTRALFKKLGHTGEPTEEMILADIFNYDQEDYEFERKGQIGFAKA